MPQDIKESIVATNLKVAVVRRQPAIKNFNNLDLSFTDEEPPGRLFPLVSRVALYSDLHVSSYSSRGYMAQYHHVLIPMSISRINVSHIPQAKSLLTEKYLPATITSEKQNPIAPQ